MSGLFVVLGLIVALGVLLTVWLKREADKAWRAHRQYVLTQPVREAMVRFEIQVGDYFTPKLIEVGKAAHRMAASIERRPPGSPCDQCGPGYRIGDDGCRHGGSS